MSQKLQILKMLKEKEWVCVTEMMQAYIPDYRRRLCDLREDKYALACRPCRQHEHRSKNLQEWKLLPKWNEEIVSEDDLTDMFGEKGKEEVKKAYQATL